jgi:hypothetical protein
MICFAGTNNLHLTVYNQSTAMIVQALCADARGRARAAGAADDAGIPAPQADTAGRHDAAARPTTGKRSCPAVAWGMFDGTRGQGCFCVPASSGQLSPGLPPGCIGSTCKRARSAAILPLLLRQEHKEFWPLVARRAHALGGRPAIEDSGLRKAWAQLLGSLARQPAPPPTEKLKAAVLLLAQVLTVGVRISGHTARWLVCQPSSLLRMSNGACCLNATRRMSAQKPHQSSTAAARHSLVLARALRLYMLSEWVILRPLQDRIDEAEDLVAELRSQPDTLPGMQVSA